MKQKPVLWLIPKLIRGVLVWDQSCQTDLRSPEAIQWRKRHQKDLHCHLTARVNFRGKLLCAKHASIAALTELAGPRPEGDVFTK